MGFIIPGKSLKSLKPSSSQGPQLKRRRRNQVQRVKRAKVTPPLKTTLQSQDNSNKTRHKLTINHLPINLMYRIFLLAGPNNNLPLLNRSMYANLQFEGDYQGSSDIDTKSWPHYSLALQMIKMYFVADLNTRLDTDAINAKIKYYELCIDRLKQTHMEVERSTFYPKLHDSLKELKLLWQDYTSVAGRYVVDALILNYRFVSSKLLKTLNSVTFGDKNHKRSLLRYKSRSDIHLNRKLRLMFLKVKFSEIDSLAKRVNLELRTENFAHSSTHDIFDKYLKFINCKDESDLLYDLDPLGEVFENPILPTYDDEQVTGGGEFSTNEMNFYNFSNGLSCGHVYFGEVESNENQFTIPNHIYIKSISSQRYFDILCFLLTQPRKKTKADHIIDEILKARKTDEYSGTKVPYLNEVTQIIFDDST
ncbi:transcription factor [Candida orthopsilosis Co 90-125]|uniref:Transcription factor n=1 Tax=Candida orthopsilosis (strain 90-125) TaxID=1136231 RepID=H8X010_CANO9|nr:transcription factor [Candida orthopsilosis Co 90-125]CCG22355.1 transcription factor [Candida orthopsilosis Co 90-125]